MIDFLCRFFLRLLLCTGVGALGLTAAETAAVVVAVQVRGTVEVQHGATGPVETVAEGRQLAATDVVTTAKGASVVLALENGAVVSLRENSRIKLTTALQLSPAGEAPPAKSAEVQESGISNTSFELAFGEMLAKVRKLNPSSTFEVHTPVSVAAVRGTVFEVSYRGDPSGPAQYRLSTASGLVHVTPREGKLVMVAAEEQMEFSTRMRGKRGRIQPVKTTKLSQQKQAQLEKESQDTERTAGDSVKRAKAAAAANAANAKGAARADDKPKDSGSAKPKDGGNNAAKDATKDAAADNAKAAAAAAKKKKAP